MKKLLIAVIMAVVLISGVAHAQTVNWVIANQGSIAWDEVTTLSNGDPIPPGSIVRYGIYSKVDGVQSDLIDEVIEPEYTYTFIDEGRYVAGVTAIRYIDTNSDGNIDSGDIRMESSVVWGDTDAPDPFGFMYYIGPSGVSGLRRQ